MKLFLITVILLTCFVCKAETLDVGTSTTPTSTGSAHHSVLKVNKKVIESLDELRLKKDLGKSYNSVKKSIENSRRKTKFNEKNIKSISKLFKESLLNRIIPFWQGTEWSFTGHTVIPKTGTIACGYFVSTTLQDIGLNVNKFKLAQQSPINEAKSLAISSKIIEISGSSSIENIKIINKKLPKGIHFIGFDDGHVGYILKENGKLYLIHSNYIMSKGVEIEKIENSMVFSSFDKFYIVELSTNEKILKNWINRKKVIVVKDK